MLLFILENNCFKMIDEKCTSGTSQIKISTFLWMLHENPEVLTNDRLQRFHTSQDYQEWCPEPMQDHEIILAREAISLGDIVTIIDVDKKNLLNWHCDEIQKK